MTTWTFRFPWGSSAFEDRVRSAVKQQGLEPHMGYELAELRGKVEFLSFPAAEPELAFRLQLSPSPDEMAKYVTIVL